MRAVRALLLAMLAHACVSLSVDVERAGAYYLNILSFGALPGNNTYEAAIVNGQAVLAAMSAANSGLNGTRSVLIPDGDFYMLPAGDGNGFYGMQDVELVLEGTVWAWTDEVDKWPLSSSGGALNLFQFTNCTNIAITGNGVVEGQGYWWWWYVIVDGHDNRPILVEIDYCLNVVMTGWTLRNSPRFHIYIYDVMNAFVYNITIHVDVEDQAALLRSAGHMTDGTQEGIPAGIPTFPLNTDGIDVSGYNITVRHCSVLNYDDSVCLKPLNQGALRSTCTEQVLFEDIDITLGVGASTGSVPPNSQVNCIRNCTFRDIRFHTPIKAIYIKPNPGTDGTGIIDHITYENIVSEGALWWSIWVSTQQQDQPGHGADTHCSFFYPLWNRTCPTQPRVPVTNLVVRNVTMHGALLSPGVLRCNDTNPCSGWLFEDVVISSATNFPSGGGFICEGIVNSTGINVQPDTGSCFNSGISKSEPEYILEDSEEDRSDTTEM